MAGHEGSRQPSSPASSHRLPTVSASQALQTLVDDDDGGGGRVVSTGLAQLNRILAPTGLAGRGVAGGYMRGKVTELFGPPGTGKTTFGIQAAANALRAGHSVVWVDAAGAPLTARRFDDVLLSVLQSPLQVPRPCPDEVRHRFHHRTAPTLAHLLALFVRPPPAFLPPHTALIVIDSLSTLLDHAYPRSPDDRAARNKTDQTRWAASRRFAVINTLISTLSRTAAMHDIALLVVCQATTRIRPGSDALLVPAISGTEWDSAISTRLVLFRDWAPTHGKPTGPGVGLLYKARFAGVLKANGVLLDDEGGVGNVVPFTVEMSGLCDMNIPAVDITAPPLSSQARPSKRRFAEIDDNDGNEGEGLGSDELYGWLEDDTVAAEGLLVDDTCTDIHISAAASGATSNARSRAVDSALRREDAGRLLD